LTIFGEKKIIEHFKYISELVLHLILLIEEKCANKFLVIVWFWQNKSPVDQQIMHNNLIATPWRHRREQTVDEK